MAMSIETLKKALNKAKTVTLTVRVRPNATKTELKGFLSDNSLKIALRAVPEAGKANQALVKFLAQEFDISQNQVTIVSGQTGRIKLVRLSLNS